MLIVKIHRCLCNTSVKSVVSSHFLFEVSNKTFSHNFTGFLYCADSLQVKFLVLENYKTFTIDQASNMALLPLESNPDVMNKFIHLLGVPEKWNIVDVYGLDGDALAWVPRPVLALILLFPCSNQFYQHAEEECKALKEKGQVVDPDIFYMKQYVSNACGTIALIHSIANNTERIGLNDGVFKSLLENAKGLTAEQRGELLLNSANNSEALKLITAHQELAMEGQTEVNPNEKVNHHFVAFVEKSGSLYELDGRKEFPINHGPTSQETFLEDAAKVCKGFMERDSEDVNFTVMALTASD